MFIDLKTFDMIQKFVILNQSLMLCSQTKKPLLSRTVCVPLYNKPYTVSS